VLAFLVTQRTREIGIRLALGGQPGHIRRLVVLEGLAMAWGGVIIGGAVALVLSRMMKGLLYDIAPTDPMTYAGIAALLIVVALSGGVCGGSAMPLWSHSGAGHATTPSPRRHAAAATLTLTMPAH